jgi:formate hydrogenlyase subunit 4
MVTFSSNPGSWLVFLILIAGAPVFGGIVNKLKARLAGRFGAPVLQPCFDLVRLAQKETVYSSSSGFIARLAPVVVWSTTAFAMMLIPLRPLPAAISFDGDFILLAYLLGLGRFLQSMVSGIAWDKPLFPIFIVVSSISIFFLMITECSRMPVDDPNTHLELTMIHEVMILDASGIDLMLYHYAAWLKLVLYTFLISSLLSPVGWLNPVVGVALFLGILMALAAALAAIETLMARFRLVLVPQFLLYATVIGVLNILIFTFSH